MRSPFPGTGRGHIFLSLLPQPVLYAWSLRLLLQARHYLTFALFFTIKLGRGGTTLFDIFDICIFMHFLIQYSFIVPFHSMMINFNNEFI